MTDIDLIAFGKEVRKFVDESVVPLRAEIEQLKEVKPEKGEPGKDAEVDLDALADLVVSKLLSSDRVATLVDLAATDAVAKHFEANPVRNGKDADPEFVKQLVRDAVADIPKPKDADPISPAQIAEAVSKHLEANPPKDGAGIADLLIDRAGELVATMTDGRMKHLGPVVGKDGESGKDGADFSDVSIDYDGERTITIRGKGGDIVKKVPIPLDRGYHRDGMDCEKGDILTHDGNAWIALRDTKAKPGHENKDDWRLLARRGRDGRDGQKVYVEPKPVSLTGGQPPCRSIPNAD